MFVYLWALRMKTEHEEQREFVAWFRQRYPGVLIFAIPNGGHRNKITAAKLKAEGVVKGVPDLFIPEERLFVEMKREKGGRLSPEQRDLILYFYECGYKCFVCKGAEDAKKQITEAMG